MPNDFGLFDMHGNIGEWCQESIGLPQKMNGALMCGGRGWIFRGEYRHIGCDSRFELPRNVNPNYVGFRLARTYSNASEK